MALPEGRREVNPSREAMGERRKPGFGSTLNVSVPISFGLPLIVIGLFLVVTAVTTGRTAFWVIGGITANMPLGEIPADALTTELLLGELTESDLAIIADADAELEKKLAPPSAATPTGDESNTPSSATATG